MAYLSANYLTVEINDIYFTTASNNLNIFQC